MPTVLATTAYAPPSCDGPLLHPFRHFSSPEEVRRLERAAARLLHVPRNTPIHLKVLAHAIIENRPGVAVWAPQTDPREYLALYETARAVLGHPQQIITVASTTTGMRPAAIVRSWAESHPAPGTFPSARTGGPLRVALFGDPLLGGDLLAFLNAHPCATVFQQGDFDLHSLETKSSLALPLGLLPLEIRMSCYRILLPLLKAEAAISVHSPFSHNAALWKCFVPGLGLPLLHLECAIPGFLTGAEKIRLENWLSIHAKIHGSV